MSECTQLKKHLLYYDDWSILLKELIDLVFNNKENVCKFKYLSGHLKYFIKKI